MWLSVSLTYLQLGFLRKVKSKVPISFNYLITGVQHYILEIKSSFFQFSSVLEKITSNYKKVIEMFTDTCIYLRVSISNSNMSLQTTKMADKSPNIKQAFMYNLHHFLQRQLNSWKTEPVFTPHSGSDDSFVRTKNT